MREIFQKLYKNSKKELYSLLDKHLIENKKAFLITANPEIFSLSTTNKEVHSMLLDDNVIISPDGEGIVKGAQMLQLPVTEKIAGVDTVAYLLQSCAKYQKKVYFYGSSQSTLDALLDKLKKEYPNIQIVGAKNGYDNNAEDVLNDMLLVQPDLILVALGVPRQELFIYQHLASFEKGVFIGVGGSLDVLSGVKKRAPQIFIKCKLEWAYRLFKEPSRIQKFLHTHVTFMRDVKKLKKEIKL